MTEITSNEPTVPVPFLAVLSDSQPETEKASQPEAEGKPPECREAVLRWFPPADVGDYRGDLGTTVPWQSRLVPHNRRARSWPPVYL